MEHTALQAADAEHTAALHRDLGIAQALTATERACINWGDLALAFLHRYCRNHATFISEDVADAAAAWGMIPPKSPRAWGAVYQRAKECGLISMCGVGRSRRRHLSICPRWKSNIYHGEAA